MQLKGAARFVYRQLVGEPNRLMRLQQGEQMQDGQYLTGVMFLLHYIGQRFAPLEIELATRATMDIMNFHRRQRKTFDVMLMRFDMVRN